jgi:hypothetical protein
MSRHALYALVLSLGLSGYAASPGMQEVADQQQNAPSVAAPLLLVISVDQMRADYLDRFGPQLTGGLRRLLDEGAVFTNARHGHAITATAPGHTALLSGLYPRDSGIIDNTWYDHQLGRRERASADPDYRIIGLDVPDDSPGGSPRQFKGTSLVGWLKEREPRSQAVSISRKDRTAVLTWSSSISLRRWRHCWASPHPQASRVSGCLVSEGARNGTRGRLTRTSQRVTKSGLRVDASLEGAFYALNTDRVVNVFDRRDITGALGF